MCEACPLAFLREGQAVPPRVGNDYEAGGIAIMFEAPTTGDAMLGAINTDSPAAKKLAELLGRAGLNRSELLLTHRIRCQPPRNRRNDYPEAVANCDDWTGLELEAYQPSVILLVGALSLEVAFGAKPKVSQLQGTQRTMGARHKWGDRLYIATYNPSAAIYRGREDKAAGAELEASMVDDYRLAKAVRDGA
jgi:uracil-DNA glycosylase family 4